LPTYRTASGLFAIQQVGYGTGTALDTAGFVNSTLFGYLHVKGVLEYGEIKPLKIPLAIQGAQDVPTLSVTIAPAAVTAGASKVNPTVVLGSLTLAPTARASIAAKSNPTVLLGSVTVSPAARTAHATKVDPSLLFRRIGPITQLSPALQPTQRYGVDFEKGPSVFLDSPPVIAKSSRVNPSVVLSSLTLAPAAIAAKGSAGGAGSYGEGGYGDQLYGDEVGVIIGSLTLAPTAATAKATRVSPTVLLDLSVRVTPAAVVAKGASTAPTLDFSGNARSIGVVTQLKPSYVPGQRYDTPFVHTAGAGPHILNLLTQLKPSYGPGPRYGDLTHEGEHEPHLVGIITQLKPSYGPGQRYGNFTHAKDRGMITQLMPNYLPGQRYAMNFAKAPAVDAGATFRKIITLRGDRIDVILG